MSDQRVGKIEEQAKMLSGKQVIREGRSEA